MSTENEEAVLEKLGRRIAKLRTRKGMTQEDLAARLAVSRSRLSHWERGSNPPLLSQLIQLGKALEVSLDKLILGDIPNPLGEPTQLERMRKHLNALKEIVAAEQKRQDASKQPASTDPSDAGPLANSGRGWTKEVV